MSTSISPVNRTRSQKLDGGRIRCVVYLPKSEVDEINEISETTGSSQSSIISQFFLKGKNAENNKNED